MQTTDSKPNGMQIDTQQANFNAYAS